MMRSVITERVKAHTLGIVYKAQEATETARVEKARAEEAKAKADLERVKAELEAEAAREEAETAQAERLRAEHAAKANQPVQRWWNRGDYRESLSWKSP